MYTMTEDPNTPLVIDAQCAVIYSVEGGTFGPGGERLSEERCAFYGSRDDLSANAAIAEAIAAFPALAGMSEYRVQALEIDTSSFAAVIVDRGTVTTG
jgi:hypothetical protein